MKLKFSALLFLLSFTLYAQSKLDYEVNKVLAYISISEANLKKAEKLIDLDKNYKEAWVREYISVEILTAHQGKIKTTTSKNDVLSQEQKKWMLHADSGEDIKVRVRYIPENNLSNNEEKLNDFTFSVEPDIAAKYAEGEEKMRQYLQENAIDKIPEGSFIGYDFAAVKFTINEEGELKNVRSFDMKPFGTKTKEEVNKILLEAIQKMPCWTPAEYADGLKVAQDYVFSVGNHENCVVPILSIREYVKE